MPVAAGLLILIYLIAFCAFILFTYFVKNMQDAAPSFPIIGTDITDFIADHIIGVVRFVGNILITGAMGASAAQQYVNAITDIRNGYGVSSTIHNFIEGILDTAGDTLKPALSAIVNYGYGIDVRANIDVLALEAFSLNDAITRNLVELHTVESIVGAIGADLANITQTVESDIGSRIDLVNALATVAYNEAIKDTQRLDNLENVTIGFLSTSLTNIENQIQGILKITATVPANIGELVTDIPILQGDIKTIEGLIGGLAGEVGDLLSDFAKLSALVGLAAIGALAIEELIKFAKDPCVFIEVACDWAWVKPALIDQMLLNGV